MLRQFHQLVQDFCALTCLDDHHAIAKGSSFCVDDIECALVYLDSITPDIVYCYIDFGLPPPQRCTEVYEKMLEAKYLQLGSSNTAFTVSPSTGHVILVNSLALLGATAEILADLFSYQAQRAVEWRDHYFLNGHQLPDLSAGGDAGMPFA